MVRPFRERNPPLSLSVFVSFCKKRYVSLGIVEKLSSNSNSFIGYKVQNYRGEEEGVMVYKSVEGFNGKSAPRWSETRL